jgi:hypothetical protein
MHDSHEPDAPLEYRAQRTILELSAARQPTVVLTNPQRFAGDHVSGMIAQFDTPDNCVWILIAPPEAQANSIARLLAAAWLDQNESIMAVPLMPTRPPVAYLLPSGEIRHTRGKRLAAWAQKEIDRLASIYCEEHSSYIEAVLGALRGRTEAFGMVPEDFLLRDPSGRFRLGPPPPSVPVDTSESERVRWNLEWYQVVSQDYARNRYLAHLSDAQLGKRIEHVVANVHIVDDFARVSLDPANPSNRYWFSRLQEIITEMHLRHGPYPNGWQRGLIDFHRMPGSLHMSQLDRRLRLKSWPHDGPILVKYTRLEFAKAAIAKGSLRIAPASDYADDSLSPAVRDHELTAETDFNPYFSGIGHDPDLDRMILPNPRRLIRHEIGTDYYVHCLAQSVSTRLLLDFEAEAAVVIREPGEFLRRLDRVVRARLPGWRSLCEQVEYYDPLQVTPAEVELPIWKHFKYAYQKEFRVAWTPPHVQPKLQPLYLEIGSLEDIGELRVPSQSRDLDEDATAQDSRLPQR